MENFDFPKNIEDINNKSLNNIKDKYLSIINEFENEHISKEEFIDLMLGLKSEIEIINLTEELNKKKELYDMVMTVINIIKTLTIFK